MSRLDELINELCPNGVEFKCLGDIGQVKMCKRILKSQTNTNGGIPFYKIGTFGGEANAFISEEVFQEYREKYSYPKVGEILISAAGTIGRTVVYDGEPAYYQDSNIVWLAHDESNILNTFLRYCYELKPWNISSGGTIARLYNDNILKAKVPVPPLEVQREIVRILDKLVEVTAELNVKLSAELTARKKQYEFYRDKLLTFGNDTLECKLKDICDIFLGLTATPNYTDAGVKFISAQNTSNDFLDLNNVKYISERDFENATSNAKPQRGDLLFTRVGSNLGHPVIVETDEKLCIFVSLGYLRIRNKKQIAIGYLKHWMNTDLFWSQVRKNVHGAAKVNLNTGWLKEFRISLPPLETQERIVYVLDNFESICTDLNIGLPDEIEARQKQYEYYRDLLLTFAETGSMLMTDRQTDRAERN